MVILAADWLLRAAGTTSANDRNGRASKTDEGGNWANGNAKKAQNGTEDRKRISLKRLDSMILLRKLEAYTGSALTALNSSSIALVHGDGGWARGWVYLVKIQQRKIDQCKVTHGDCDRAISGRDHRDQSQDGEEESRQRARVHFRVEELAWLVRCFAGESIPQVSCPFIRKVGPNQAQISTRLARPKSKELPQ